MIDIKDKSETQEEAERIMDFLYKKYRKFYTDKDEDGIDFAIPINKGKSFIDCIVFSYEYIGTNWYFTLAIPKPFTKNTEKIRSMLYDIVKTFNFPVIQTHLFTIRLEPNPFNLKYIIRVMEYIFNEISEKFGTGGRKRI